MAYRPANKGKRCQGWKRVPSVYGGRVWRCTSYGAGPRARRRRGGYRKPPFNKGRKCKATKQVYSPAFGKTVTRCASYKTAAAGAAVAPVTPLQPRTLTVPWDYGQEAAYTVTSRPRATVTASPIPFIPDIPLPSYAQPTRPIHEARQMTLPGTGKRRGPRAPRQADLPFQAGLPPRMAVPPPPPPKKRTRRRLTEHERLMRAIKKSPGRYLDGWP